MCLSTKKNHTPIHNLWWDVFKVLAPPQISDFWWTDHFCDCLKFVTQHLLQYQAKQICIFFRIARCCTHPSNTPTSTALKGQCFGQTCTFWNFHAVSSCTGTSQSLSFLIYHTVIYGAFSCEKQYKRLPVNLSYSLQLDSNWALTVLWSVTPTLHPWQKNKVVLTWHLSKITAIIIIRLHFTVLVL